MRILLASTVAISVLIAGCSDRGDNKNSNNPQISDDNNKYYLTLKSGRDRTLGKIEIGTIASSTEICEVLKHNGNYITGETYDVDRYSTKSVISYNKPIIFDWIESRTRNARNALEYNSSRDLENDSPDRYEVSSETVQKIYENLNSCLESINTSDPDLFNKIQNELVDMSSQPSPEVPCYNNVYITEEFVDSEGNFQKRNIVNEERQPCTSALSKKGKYQPAVSYSFYFRRVPIVNLSDEYFEIIALLGLREGGTLAKNLADRNLARLNESAN